MAVREYIQKFCLMNWKNCKLQVGNPLQLLFILLCPPAFISVALALRFLIPMKIRTDKIYEAIDLQRSWLEMVEKLENRRTVAESHNFEKNPWTPILVIGWAPRDYNVFQQIMTNAEENFEPMKLISFKNCAELRKKLESDSMFAGICFKRRGFKKKYNIPIDIDIWPHFSYSIIMPSELRQLEGEFRRGNWYTLYTYDPQTVILDRLNQPDEGGFVGYVREGFILIQKYVSESFLNLISDKVVPPIVLRRFPVLGSREDPLMFDLDSALSLLILVGYLFPSLIFIWQIVSEKQTHMRSFLVNMSIGNLIQFISWYTTCLVCFIISTVITTVLLKVPWNLNDAVLTQAPVYNVLLVLICYCAVASSYVLMMASFFTDPHMAVRVATIVWVAFHMPNFVLWNSMSQAAWAFRYVSYLIPNVVLHAIFECIVERETITHSSYNNPHYNRYYRTCALPVYSGIWIFLVNCLIYSGIGLYMEIWRLGGRSAKRINKEETRTTSIPEEQTHNWSRHTASQVREIDVNSTKIYEVEPSNRRFKVKIKKLCKRYGFKDRPALNLFTWNVYENEVTVLMGHNGSGKTTLLKILAGLTEANRGSVTIGNYDMLTEKKAACMELGLALDTKMLITGLTVRDHLRFICRVKGMHSLLDIDGHVSYFMNALQIDHLKDKRLHKLKPRHLVLVTICCAFVGESSIILIDDIYSDLDTPTKALIWALINEEKSNRTIIIVVNTTLLAEAIADRLAFMSNGELKCTGTKPFLKNMYGHGFRLICAKGKNCKISELIELMSRHLPNLTIESQIGFKLNFVLENKDEEHFLQLFDDLEKNMERLDVVGFRVRDTSTEEIFLRFGCDEEDHMGGTLGFADNPNILINKYFDLLAEVDSNRREGGFGLWRLNVRAIFFMRQIIDFKHWAILLLVILSILMAALCTFSGAFIYGKHYDLAPLTFNFSAMPDISVFTELIIDDADLKDTHEYYKESLYWYDVEVQALDRTGDGSYALTHNNEFARIVNSAYLFGATFDKNLLTAWFNNIPLHVAPISLNAIHNAVARNFLDQDAVIDVTLETLSFRSNLNVFPPGVQAFGVTMASTICFVLCFIATAQALFVIRERSGYLRKLQFLAGARQFSHFALTIFYDIINQLLFITVLVVMVAIYHHPEHDFTFYILLLLAILMAGTLKTLITHLVASLCRSPIYGFIVVSFISSLGFLVFQETYRHNPEELSPWLFMFHQYVSAVLILKLFNNYENKLYCSDELVKFTSIEVYKCQTNPNCCVDKEYTNANDGVVTDFLILTAWIVVVSVLLFVFEFHNLQGLAKYLPEPKEKSQLTQNLSRMSDSAIHGQISNDQYAQIERQRNSNLSPEERSEQAFVAVDLVSRYGKVEVLKGFNLTLAKGECLNIAGFNDAGRSTLLKIIVREAKLYSGQMWIHGHSVRRHRTQTYRMIGYCPQNNILPPELTPRQLLYMLALFHGHPKKDAERVSEALIRMLGLFQSCDRSVRFCTSGEERRLFFAFAILSNPQLVCVDGVPAGLDPVAKRIVLMVTNIMQSMGSAFLYTSLPVLDTERLCVRRAVMYGGELWMVGSVETENKTLKICYQLEVRFKRKVNPNLSMSRSTWNRINHFPLSPHRKFIAFMEIKFPTAVLISDDDSLMVFHISVESTTFSTILLTIRRDAFEMNIEDYFIARNIRITHLAER